LAGPRSESLKALLTVEPTTEQAVREAVEEMSRLDFLLESPLAIPMLQPF
jgi:hypothetical protein